jgi:hypothetical protein
MEFKSKKLLGGERRLVLNETTAEYFEPGCCCSQIHDTVQIAEVRFFDRSGKMIYFGYQDQIAMAGLKPEEKDAVEKHLKDHGANLGQNHEWTTKGIFSKDSIAVADDGVYHKSKAGGCGCCGGESKSTFLAYDKIYYAGFTGCLGFIFGKKLILAGELNIITDKKFSTSIVNKIKENLEKTGTRTGEGSVYHPSLFKALKDKALCDWCKTKTILTDKGVLILLSKKYRVKAKEVMQGKDFPAVRYVPYENIVEVKKKNGWLQIEGANLRTTEGNFFCGMPAPGCCSGIVNAIKSKASAAKSR